MLFNSTTFWFFFAIVFSTYAVLSRRWQNGLLLVASYVFYGWWDYRFLVLMLASTVFDYVVGLKLATNSFPTARRRWITASLVGNLGLLGCFKYFNFFLDSTRSVLELMGFHADLWTLSIILPAGISFYTFQSLSYTIDIYRGHIQPARNFWDFALSVSFFPHLVAGPIQRADSLLRQIERPRSMTWDGWCEGSALVLIGLFKKMAIADMLAPLVERTFSRPEQCSSLILLFGVYCFAVQIYADFSGYTDIARGVARFMGFELMINFNQPYFAADITDFWRRWHISLSTWLRDYLYISLGGNRHGTLRTYRNLMLTMVLGGLWHGAAWTFVVWGALHGLYLAAHKFVMQLVGTQPLPERIGSEVSTAETVTKVAA